MAGETVAIAYDRPMLFPLAVLALVLGFWLIVYGAFQIFIAMQLRKGVAVGGPGAVRPAIG